MWGVKSVPTIYKEVYPFLTLTQRFVSFIAYICMIYIYIIQKLFARQFFEKNKNTIHQRDVDVFIFRSRSSRSLLRERGVFLCYCRRTMRKWETENVVCTRDIFLHSAYLQIFNEKLL